ncbi:MAG: propanediol utilization microcompartment protein PduB [Gracilibacteraceae bacterium]|jgi:microcompartment protein PduB|nr:propanediol utilization microcompartment protein PduB [Gracilibacteraceae bacterium]
MDKDLLVSQIMEKLQNMDAAGATGAAGAAGAAPQLSVGEAGKNYKLFSPGEQNGFTELVGTGLGDTIGLVIPNLDAGIHVRLGIDKKIRSLGIISSRSAVGPQCMGADDALKSSNCELVMVQLPRDTKGGAGHGILIIFGAEDVSDARRAVEITLKSFEWSWGDQYGNEAGHCEVQYTARAGEVLATCFNAKPGKAWGIICGAPAAVGLIMADRAAKAADIEIVMHATPNLNTSNSNEFMIMFTGDSGAVKQAAIEGREIGIQALTILGGPPVSSGGKPYIF